MPPSVRKMPPRRCGKSCRYFVTAIVSEIVRPPPSVRSRDAGSGLAGAVPHNVAASGKECGRTAGWKHFEIRRLYDAAKAALRGLALVVLEFENVGAFADRQQARLCVEIQLRAGICNVEVA